MQKMHDPEEKSRLREQERTDRYNTLERLSRLDRGVTIGVRELAAILGKKTNTINFYCSKKPHKVPPRLEGRGREWCLGTALDWNQERDKQGRGQK